MPLRFSVFRFALKATAFAAIASTAHAQSNAPASRPSQPSSSAGGAQSSGGAGTRPTSSAQPTQPRRQSSSPPRAAPGQKTQVDCSIPPATVDLIARDLAPKFFRTPRAVRFYHYARRGPGGYGGRANVDEIAVIPDPYRGFGEPRSFAGRIPLRPWRTAWGDPVDALLEYFEGMARAHLEDAASTHWYLGRGLYAAVDPVASVGYGQGDTGFLLEIETPAGVGALDLRNGQEVPGLPLRPDALDAAIALMRAGRVCGQISGTVEALPSELAVPAYGEVKLRDLARSFHGRFALRKVYERLGVEMLVSNWGRHSYVACATLNSPRFRSGTDVVFVNPSLATRVGLRAFVPFLRAEIEPREKLSAYARILALMNLSDEPRAQVSRALAQRLYTGFWEPHIEATAPEAPWPTPREIFGCSSDPAHAAEIWGPRQEDAVFAGR